MEYIALEKEGLNLIKNKLEDISKAIKDYNLATNEIGNDWIENNKLAKLLNVSIRTLQSYRDRGVIGYSMIGKKIYYKREEIISLLDSGRIIVKSKK